MNFLKSRNIYFYEQWCFRVKGFLFISLASKIGTTAKRFEELLLKFIEKYKLIISSYINPKKENSYGV